MSSEMAIKVDNLSKCYQIYDNPRDRLMQMLMRGRRQYYREFWALRDVALEVKKGETVGIIGCNGSGKSTLLQLICGTLSPTSGLIETKGRIAALLELGSGFNPEFTGRENVYMNASILGLGKGEIDARFDDIVAFADIGEFLEQPVKTYSSGMAVRLAFSVAINVEPEILIVDEALSVGDELFQRKCFSRIETIREGGGTILFVSHSGAQIVELCDRAILMDAGEKLAEGAPKSVVGKYQKFLYAPYENRIAIRNEIIESGIDSISGRSVRDAMSSREFVKNTSEIAAEENDFFDPSLMPISTIKYESHGAHIENPDILTLSGKKVNFLTRGKSYLYVYDVKFTEGVTNVRFGMLIKTSSGLELGGAVSAPHAGEGISYVAPGSVLRITYRFNCSLNPGVYYLNAGVMGINNGFETFLHRILDGYMFRVMHIPDDIATAAIDFGCSPKILDMTSTVLTQN